MRRLAFSALLFVAACAPVAKPVATVPVPVEPVRVERGDLIGLTAGELGQRFGAPDLQVREGAGLKLQYRAKNCVLDAYLYGPESGQGVARVMHVDTRDREGRDTAQTNCEAALIAER
ncbi:MAG: hypothetical protein ABIR51_10235 [Sphingomicrobium sp.]